MKLKLFFALVTAVLVFNACKKTDSTDPGISFPKTILNVAYGTAAIQVMDIYLPANRSSSDTRVLVMIHGGGWSAGDKSDMTPFVDSFQRRFPNFSVFNVNYRLAGNGTNLFPTQELDIKQAIEFIYSKRSEYAVSDKFALLGVSAGAHLSLLQAYKYEEPVKVRAVVDFFGPTDMRAMYDSPATPLGALAMLNVMGITPQQNGDLYAQSSPINYINEFSSPTLIFHGGADNVVKHEQSDSLFARLDSANVIATYVKYPTQNHGWTGDTLYHSFNQVQSFLETRMQ